MKRRDFLRGALTLGAVGLLPGVGLATNRLLGGTPPIVEPVSVEPVSLPTNTSAAQNMMWRAIEEGKIEIVKSLIKQGFALNAEVKGGKTALQVAVYYRKVAITRFLISRGADVNFKDRCGDTPLHDAPMWASFETYPSRLLRDMAAQEHVDIANLLIFAGADVNAKGVFGYTPLHQAAKFGLVELVKTLVFHGADVNARDNRGGTPLGDARVNMCDEYVEVAQFLISAGADVNAKGGNGCTPLHGVASVGDIEVAKMLVLAGAVIEATNDYNATPLHSAIRNGKSEVAEYLLVQGADPTGFTYDADVVLVSPDNFSVALTLEQHPWCRARGKGWIGERIRKIAMEKNIPVHNAPEVEHIADNGYIPSEKVYAGIALSCAAILHAKGSVRNIPKSKQNNQP